MTRPFTKYSNASVRSALNHRRCFMNHRACMVYGHRICSALIELPCILRQYSDALGTTESVVAAYERSGEVEPSTRVTRFGRSSEFGVCCSLNVEITLHEYHLFFKYFYNKQNMNYGSETSLASHHLLPGGLGARGFNRICKR